MNGPKHYREAERLLSIARESENAPQAVGQILAEAQIHATLALTAAVCDGPGEEQLNGQAWEAAMNEVDR